MAIERLHYLDNLRALAMLAGVLFHAALAYSPLMQPFWPLADRSTSAVADVFAWFLHFFRMPLFFMIAGYFSAMLIEQRGMGGMFANRVQRVLLPFVVLWLPVILSLTWSTEWAAANVEHPSAVLKIVREWSTMADPPQLPPGTSHLWFLYYLMWFYILQWALGSVFATRKRLQSQLPLWTWLIAPLLLVPSLLSVTAPHPAPESFLPQFWAIGFFGFFFALGTTLRRQPQLLDALRRWSPGLAISSMLLYIAWLYGLRRLPPDPGDLAAPWQLAVLGAFISLWMTLHLWIAGQRFLNVQHPWLRYLAAGSYWTYLVHLPVLFVIQYGLMDQAFGWLTKLAISVAATLAICFFSYEVLVRRTQLRRWLG